MSLSYGIILSEDKLKILLNASGGDFVFAPLSPEMPDARTVNENLFAMVKDEIIGCDGEKFIIPKKLYDMLCSIKNAKNIVEYIDIATDKSVFYYGGENPLSIRRDIGGRLVLHSDNLDSFVDEILELSELNSSFEELAQRLQYDVARYDDEGLSVFHCKIYTSKALQQDWKVLLSSRQAPKLSISYENGDLTVFDYSIEELKNLLIHALK